MINIENFDSSLIKIDKSSYKNIDIYNTGYITIKRISEYVRINSVSPLYQIIGELHGHIEENNRNKYLIFASTDRNKEVLIKYAELWSGFKNLIEKIKGRLGEYEKDFKKFKFSSDDNLPFNKMLKLHNLTVIFSRGQQILFSSSLRCMFAWIINVRIW